jgi:hypothetical protein
LALICNFVVWNELIVAVRLIFMGTVTEFVSWRFKMRLKLSSPENRRFETKFDKLLIKRFV